MLEKGLMKDFVPAEAEDQVRLKMYSLKQTSSVAEYNSTFWHLYLQIMTDFQEAKYAYLQRLTTKIQNLIYNENNIINIQELQAACFRLNDH